jgi:hypothetical protein
MEADRFWSIIGGARRRCDGDWKGVPAIVTRTLTWLPLDEIAGFAEHHDRFEFDAYRGGLWTACTLINGGFGSGDLFLYFRNWLIVQGRQVYEAALADADSLADVPAAMSVTATGNDFAACQEFLWVSYEAWDGVTGEDEGLSEELERRGYRSMRDNEGEPDGTVIDLDDREAIFAKLPRLAAHFYDRALARITALG